MKKQGLASSLLSASAGCAATTPAPESAGFVGTKWNQVISFLGEHNVLEFVDETTCAYTFFEDLETHTYEVTGDKIKFAGDTYTIMKKGDKITSQLYTGYLKNDTLLLHGNPYWAKE